MLCPNCGNIWDGAAQCPCWAWVWWIADAEEEEEATDSGYESA